MRFGIRVRDVLLIDQQGLTAELVGKLFNWLVVLDPVHCLASLQVKFHTLLRLMLLQGQNQLVDNLEDFQLINFDKLHCILIVLCLQFCAHAALHVG